jgi:hypothetical protein
MTTDNFCFDLSNKLIQTSQKGGQQYNDTSPFGISWSHSILQPHSAFPSRLDSQVSSEL